MREDECECVILAIQASYQLLMPRPRIYNPPPHPHYFMSQPAVPEKKLAPSPPTRHQQQSSSALLLASKASHLQEGRRERGLQLSIPYAAKD